MPDNYTAYEAYERDVEVYRSRLPRCAKCGDPITSEKAYDIDGWYCEDCKDEWIESVSTWTDNIDETEEW